MHQRTSNDKLLNADEVSKPEIRYGSQQKLSLRQAKRGDSGLVQTADQARDDRVGHVMRAFIASIFLVPKFQRLSYRCAIALYLLILILGSIPGARVDIGQYASGGALHSVAYSILTVLLFSGNKGNRSERAVKSVFTIMAMGALDEYVQSFFPYRNADVMDWAVDVISGLVIATTLWTLWPRIIDSE
ncbi:MAG: VanZ family protein [Propionivibrio sp.]|uniref:VanZ family protein n=1 Tax=Propionivibrio sp. TaxID=2212460 RepID=UPI001A5CBB3D|nr:VanZ family protein [Propionivibrio sp.]MBL8413501.1 VanZ family protein [Propionivibrio sp.]